MRAKTWHSIGLAETRQIGKIVVDPADPNLVYVAALGHAYKANPERGVYRSTDGGAHWTKILSSSKNPDDVGAVDLALDPLTSSHHLRIALGNAPSAMGGLCAVEHARRRPVQIHRRRRHLASTHRRPAHGRFRWQDRHCRRAQQSRIGSTQWLTISAPQSRVPIAFPLQWVPTRPNPPAVFISLTMPALRGDS